MISRSRLRKMFQGNVAAAGTGNERQGAIAFVGELNEALGLAVRDKETGDLTESVDEAGCPVFAEGRIKPEEFSLRDLAWAIGGESFVERFDPAERANGMTLLEAGPGIDPTVFLNTSTFSAATAGLLNAGILEKFKHPSYIGDELFERKPTRMNGEKMIGVGGFTSTAGSNARKPGERHARISFGDRWVTTPELEEKAAAVEVTQEAVFYDQTGQVLDEANAIGDVLGYEREKVMLRLFAGISNSYVYKGTAYDTYQASTPWINTHTNAAADYTDVDNAIALLTAMTNPETGREIMMEKPLTIVHDPDVETLWHFILNSTQIRSNINTNDQMYAPPPPSAGNYRRLSSVILRNLIDLEGGRTLAQAKGDWFIGNPKRAFMWMEAWPLRVDQVSATEYEMKDRGLIFAAFANYRGIPAVREPRHVIRNRAA